MTWYTYASMSANSAVSTNFWNGSRSVMNLVMLNVKIPDPIQIKFTKLNTLIGELSEQMVSPLSKSGKILLVKQIIMAQVLKLLIMWHLESLVLRMGGFILNPTKQPQQQQLPLRPQPPQLLQQLPPLNRQPQLPSPYF